MIAPTAISWLWCCLWRLSCVCIKGPNCQIAKNNFHFYPINSYTVSCWDGKFLQKWKHEITILCFKLMQFISIGDICSWSHKIFVLVSKHETDGRGKNVAFVSMHETKIQKILISSQKLKYASCYALDGRDGLNCVQNTSAQCSWEASMSPIWSPYWISTALLGALERHSQGPRSSFDGPGGPDLIQLPPICTSVLNSM